jgi:hypothetical protein
MTDSKDSLENIATEVAKLYSNPIVMNFIPRIGGSRKSNFREALSTRVKYNLAQITGKKPLDIILKNTLSSNILPETKKTKNGIAKDELQQGIDILKAQINNLIAANKNSENDKELEMCQEFLSILEETYIKCLELDNFEEVTDFKDIAAKTLKILSKSDDDAENLFILINRKLGIPMEHKTKKEKWMERWEHYEKYEKDHMKCELDENEQRQYTDYLRIKNRNNYNRDRNNNYRNNTRRDNTHHDNNRRDNTRRDNTHHDNNRRDNTRHDNARHDNTRHDNTRHDNTHHDNNRRDNTRRDNARYNSDSFITNENDQNLYVPAYMKKNKNKNNDDNDPSKC